MQGGGVGLQLSTAADGLPLPTCVVAFDQELAGGTQPAAQCGGANVQGIGHFLRA